MLIIWIQIGYANIQFPYTEKKFQINSSIVKRSGLL